ncbi:hypothetical protein [Streptomyces sp. NPDC092307]|uniref:hypothetical protein n=1 Tax=Streptomyces sp. NPDC092307 TaxID=3366013 RepID=UPI003828C02C
MTKAHVPPQKAGNKTEVVSAIVRIHDQQRSYGRPTKGGMWLRGLCGDCNSLAGRRYDEAYADFARRLSTYARTHQLLYLPRPEPAPPVRLAPGRVARSVLIGMFATTPHLRQLFPGLADDLLQQRPHITMPDGAVLRLALYPARKTRLASMYNGMRVLGQRQYYHVFSEVYFRPLAWVLGPNGRGDLTNLGASVLDAWAPVDHWLQYGDDVTSLDLRDLCRRGIPALHCHPLEAGRDQWIEAFSSDVLAVIEGEIPSWSS